ncbi:FAD-dependent monooxygenase [Spirillospora sp. NPDC048911]|uniref:FAD-dependent monooxygenase n=1 Tax=Spirillospora sp. NPDC048911 TaxID=3364527 RepID=UPI003719F2E1
MNKVAIVGAGPTGLALAAELALAGVPCDVFDRRPGPRTDSRAITLHARSMELLDLRGIAGRFADAGLPLRGFPLGLKGAAIDFGRLDSDFPYMLGIPQSRIEELLGTRARELGAEIRWSHRVSGIQENADHIQLEFDSAAPQRYSYVVGCDGLRSSVREAAGIPFPGFPNPGSVSLADVYLDGLPMDDAYGELTDRGMLLVLPFRDGSCRVVLYDYAKAGTPIDEPVTLDEVRDGITGICGRDLEPRDMYWSGRYRSESRQAPTYRKGRILLAGDAAHTHSPAGAQGLNAGVQDSFNLGWKLAAVLQNRATESLLDSYTAERHPVGAAVLALTGRQFKLNTAKTRRRKALRWVAQRIIAPLPPVQDRLARAYSGISIAYPDASNDLAGTRLPRGTVTLPDGTTERLYDLFHKGDFVLLTPEDDTLDNVRTVRYKTLDAALPATTLIRPDGYLAWASDTSDPTAPKTALQRHLS